MPKCNLDYSYIYEKFSDARRTLMLPSDVNEAIFFAFHECMLGLHQFEVEKIPDEYARDGVKKLKSLMNTSNIEPEGNQGTWAQKIVSFEEDDRRELVRLVDELASYFGREYWRDK